LKAAEIVRERLNEPVAVASVTVRALVKGFRAEKMPERFSTRRGYDAWLNNYVLPRWEDADITALQPRPVELWLKILPISPKSRVHIRGLLRGIWEYAMWSRSVPTQRNPMELVSIKGASKRQRVPRSLTVEEFQALCTAS